ncbi:MULTISPECIES: ComEA family DNA-binding protein [Halomonadaceae]|uniref:DNA-binding protein n=1 Tax=Vreelandella halophila TaxID=86177 RepID=A0A9X4YCZ7_9GAMM|nr:MULTISPECIES: helix-hairpin-helix domain-containing protein [Halomonas]MYL27562.1 DNA-binding protein [Halomonas utahensis]MYL74688.1 DNA-binding protein [Halomonas sp. 22501_18_FS]
MRFFNFGDKDEYGRQRRIEHRGRFLRASRTGGVALRAQAEAAGVNVTANTSQGFRLSSTPLQNTQVALQNGRFVLRGRYGSGPTKLNVSKTGATVSTRNALGSFNWIKPNRSSAKVAGVQVRGKNAAYLQGIYMLFVGAAMALKLLVQLLVLVFQLAVWLGDMVYRLALATPYAWAVLKRRFRNGQLRRRLLEGSGKTSPTIDEWSSQEQVAGIVLILVSWGQGQRMSETLNSIQGRVTQSQEWPLLASAAECLDPVAERLESARENASDPKAGDPRLFIAALAGALEESGDQQTTAEAILQADELALAVGERTELQEQSLQVYGDFAGIRFQEPEVSPAGSEEEARDMQASTPEYGAPQRSRGDAAIDLNTASFEELQEVPHMGPERAEEVIAMRPVTDLSQLRSIDGIGAKRLADIEAHVRLG